MPHEHAPRVAKAWTVIVAPTLGGSFRPATQRALPSTGFSPTPAALDLSVRMRLPAFAFAVDSIAAAPACDSWMATPAAQAAERWISPSSANAIPPAMAFRQPDVGRLPVDGVHVRQVTTPLGGSFRAATPQAVPSAGRSPSPATLELSAGLRMPRFDFDADTTAQPTGADTATVPPCASWMPTPGPQAAERWVALSTAEAIPAATLVESGGLRMPRFDFDADTAAEPTRASSDAGAATALPPCASWMAAPEPQAAERWVALSTAEAIPAAIAFRQPDIGKLPVSATHVRQVTELAPSLEPEPVARDVRAVMNSRPASSYRGPALIRFSLHAVEEIVARPAATVQAPRPAGARPGPAPMPVESMPVVPAHAPAAMAPSVHMVLPGIRALTAQVLPQARAVQGPAAMAVESMPTVAQLVPLPVAARPALRLPTLAHFQPAEDNIEILAAPTTAPGPAPVESMPAAAAFRALPLPVRPVLVAQTFYPELRARFDMPRVAGPAPVVAEPPVPQPQPALLHPISRIATQPAGAQPERPTPAIPQPGAFPLEYYCQRITSFPAKRIQPMTPRVALQQQPFAIEAALGKLEDLLKKKPTRLVLPFEEIFNKRKAQDAKRSRININRTGKIAAAVMVGIALWAGSRIANLSQHTEEFRAQVAASERTVAVGESAGIDPTQGNFGTGPVGKARRAIANRAAMEITDTFKAGMRAWGAEAQSWAPGWKRNPQGYVSTGDMALFQPSLKYTDYRMEFYGQIEDKSLGWVVRAQDKKNYYAMKFTVTKPGLRPIISMVHYGVVDGKAGHKVETPLSVMVHNNRPMHVAVDVRGKRFTASIDGERIESWTDDASAQGGVGFFSDPGEKARLYWMKLSRNQDWLGRFCAYLSKDGKQQTAEMWGPGIPNNRAPAYPQLPALALAAAGPFKIRKHRRSEAWTF
jgi:hypothetical protein